MKQYREIVPKREKERESKTSILMTALVMLNNNQLLLFLPFERVLELVAIAFFFVNFFSFALLFSFDFGRFGQRTTTQTFEKTVAKQNVRKEAKLKHRID